MDCKQKRMGIVGCFGQIENIKRQSLNNPDNCFDFVIKAFKYCSENGNTLTSSQEELLEMIENLPSLFKRGWQA